MYDRSDLVTSPVLDTGIQAGHTAGGDEERYICTSDPFIPSSSPKPTGGWNRWLDDPNCALHSAKGLHSTKSREALSLTGSVFSLVPWVT